MRHIRFFYEVKKEAVGKMLRILQNEEMSFFDMRVKIRELGYIMQINRIMKYSERLKMKNVVLLPLPDLKDMGKNEHDRVYRILNNHWITTTEARLALRALGYSVTHYRVKKERKKLKLLDTSIKSLNDQMPSGIRKVLTDTIKSDRTHIDVVRDLNKAGIKINLYRVRQIRLELGIESGYMNSNKQKRMEKILPVDEYAERRKRTAETLKEFEKLRKFDTLLDKYSNI